MTATTERTACGAVSGTCTLDELYAAVEEASDALTGRGGGLEVTRQTFADARVSRTLTELAPGTATLGRRRSAKWVC